MQFLICLYKYCFFLIILNFISILVFPQGLYADIRGITETNYLLGNYNSFICKILPALGVGYHLLQTGFISKKNYGLLWLIVIATYLQVQSVTSILGISILGIFLLFFNNKVALIIFNAIFYSISTLYLSCFFIYSHTSVIFSFITNIAGKSSTLSGRTVLWDKIVKLLSKSPIFGFGVHSNADLIEYFGLNYAGHAHNFPLQVLFQTGIIGGVLSLTLVILTINILLKTSFSPISRCYGCIYFSLFVMLSADFYGYAMIFQIILLINFICQDIYKDFKDIICSTG